MTLTGASLSNCPNGLAFDGHGNLWVANVCNSPSIPTVVEFAASQLATSGTPTPTVSINVPFGLGISGAGLAFTP